jgi:ferric-dicitrate binding protein FerR (iron transport regulator)
MSARKYTTQQRQIAVVTLRDGTRVTLAPNSTLTVSNDAQDHSRLVELTGEAYFDISTSRSIPFVVRSHRIVLRVLGTTFDVRHYPGESSVLVAVTGGKVLASAPHAAPVTLVAGTVTRVADSTIVTVKGDATNYTAWVDGRLVFRETPVSEMLDVVGRMYGYEFRLADTALAAERITATFEHKSPSEVLAAMKMLLDVSMQFERGVVTLNPQSRLGRPKAPSRMEWKDSTNITRRTEVGR